MKRKFKDCDICANYRKNDAECETCDCGENFTEKEAEKGLNFEDETYGWYEEK